MTRKMSTLNMTRSRLAATTTAMMVMTAEREKLSCSELTTGVPILLVVMGEVCGVVSGVSAVGAGVCSVSVVMGVSDDVCGVSVTTDVVDTVSVVTGVSVVSGVWEVVAFVASGNKVRMISVGGRH